MGQGQPWRKHSEEFNWSNNYAEKLRKSVKNVADKMTCSPNLLVFGPSGHGKSSFINSLSSISRNSISNITNSGRAIDHMTSKFRKYKLQGVLDSVQIADTKGIVGTNEDNRYLVDNIVDIINGHIKHGAKFTSDRFPNEGEFFIDSPKLSDTFHCIVFVLDIRTFAKWSEMFKISIKEPFMSLLKELNELDVPRIVVLTHVDKLDPDVDSDITNIFNSRKVELAIFRASETLGIPTANIFPVVNYDSTSTHQFIRHATNIPLLIALESAVNFASDTVHKMTNR